MIRRFVIVTNGATAEQQNAITAYVRTQSVGWWHWFRDVWLLHDSQNKITARTLRDGISEACMPLPPTMLVLQFEGRVTWAGRILKRNADPFAWVKKYFSAQSSDD